MNSDTLTANTWVTMGRFCRPHGIKGFIRVLSFTDPRENILNYPRWFIQVNNTWELVKRLDVQVTHHHVLVRIENYATRESVSNLTNLDIAVLADDRPKLDPGEYYWDDLVGMQVVDAHGAVMGIVHEMMATGSNDVMVVEGVQRQLIPYLPGDVVLDVDPVARTISVAWDVDF